MFKTKPKDTFPFKAPLHAPGVGRAVCGFEGRHLSGEGLKNQLAAAKDDNEFVVAVVVDWNRKDFDEDFSSERLSEMLAAYPGLSTQIAKAYLAELSGAPAAKN